MTSSATEASSKRSNKKSDLLESLVKPYDPSAAVYDIPIFSDLFLEHNRSREQHLRHLRQVNSDLEQNNAVISKHIDEMRSTTARLDADLQRERSHSEAVESYLRQYRNLLIGALSSDFKELAQAINFTSTTKTSASATTTAIGGDGSGSPKKFIKDEGVDSQLTVENVDDFVAQLMAAVAAGGGSSGGSRLSEKMRERIKRILMTIKFDCLPAYSLQSH